MPDLALPSVGLGHYLALATILFGIGVLGVILRRNALILFMSVELMLASVNLSFLAFARQHGNHEGHVMVLFALAVAAAEAAVGLAILVELYRKRDSVDIDEYRELSE